MHPLIRMRRGHHYCPRTGKALSRKLCLIDNPNLQDAIGLWARDNALNTAFRCVRLCVYACTIAVEQIEALPHRPSILVPGQPPAMVDTTQSSSAFQGIAVEANRGSSSQARRFGPWSSSSSHWPVSSNQGMSKELWLVLVQL
eukprot:scaffold118884_cov20-Tisochrysis_lutea.AAC.1